jgi:LuxR family maltose regulon positive regulatory protein
MLEELERANLFLVPLDDERLWYRYHHLFAEVLRQRLKRGATGDTVSALHRRATAWYEQQGLVVEAIHHAFLAGDVEWAARLIEQATQTLWMRGEQTTLLGWLKALPQAVVQARPRLLLAHAWTQFVIEPEQAGTVEAILQDMEVVLGCDDGGTAGSSREVSAGDGELAELRGTLKAIQAGVASMQGDIPRTIALAEAALASLPVDNVMWRTVAAADLGIAYALSGNVQAASRTFAEAIALCRRAGNGYLELVATNGLAQVRMIQGQLRAAAALYRQAQDTAAQQGGGQLPYTGLLDLGLGKLLYESNDLERATQHLLQGIERLRLQARPSGLLEGYAALAQAKQAQGDEAGRSP